MSACNVFERSANRNNGNNVANCNSDGNVNNNNAYNGNRCRADCVGAADNSSLCEYCGGRRDARSPLPAGESPEQRWGRRAPASRGGGASAVPDIEDVIGMDALLESTRRCMTGVAWKGRSAWFWLHRVEVCSRLCDELHDGTYKPGRVVRFPITSPKPRVIVATDFVDRVVQRSFNDNLIYPAMSRSWIRDNCACQFGKGTDFARERLRCHLERHYRRHGLEGAVLCMDIRGYYDHMVHAVTEERFAGKLPDWGFGFARDTFRSQYEGERGYNPGSQMVQIAGIDYLDPTDHFIKERLGIKGYVRYMDDLILMHEDAGYLAECLEAIRDRLTLVGLEPHPRKTHIEPISRPIAFLGFDHRLTADGKVIKFVQSEKAKQTRRDLRSLARLLRQGRLTQAQFDASYECRLAHMRKGDSAALLARMDDYRSYVLKGA